MVNLDDVTKIIAQAALEWSANMTEEEIKKRVFKILDDKQEHIVSRIMGFTNKWGAWELDDKKGWFINNYMKLHEDAIKEYAKTFNPPTLTARGKQTILRDVNDEFAYSVRKQLMETIREQADETVKALYKELIPDSHIDKHIAALKLLMADRK